MMDEDVYNFYRKRVGKKDEYYCDLIEAPCRFKNVSCKYCYDYGMFLQIIDYSNKEKEEEV